MTQIDKRTFSVSPSIIYSLIKAQAGSLAKGLLECIMNSVDAGATRVDIELRATTMKVVDNGKGFQTRAEIEACFEVFGFEHQEGDRTYGQFGIGRAQLWNFASTVWHTNQFRMDVDIKRRGLDYDLVEHRDPVAGLVIDGKFYEPLSTSDILDCERELKELAKYVSVPVTFNGEGFTKNPAEQKWTHETDDAWIRLNSTARYLTVYNLGVKVRDYSAWQFGCGGLVVTKPGVRLALNMARNDIVQTECKVWKRVKPYLQKKSDDAVKRSPRLTGSQLANLCTRFLAGDLAYADISSRKVIVDVTDAKCTIGEFLRKVRAVSGRVVTFVRKDEAGPVSEQAHRSGFCFVLGEQTLLLFGVDTLEDFRSKLQAAMTPDCAEVREGLTLFKAVENWRDACKSIVEGYTEVQYADWTPRERAAMSALTSIALGTARMLKTANLTEGSGKERELRIGVSEVATAWTDGTDIIWLNRGELQLLDKGLSGASRLMSVLVHEYLHEEPSTGTHVHDLEFYQRFHNALLLSDNGWGSPSPGELVQRLMGAYVRECAKRKVPVKSRAGHSLDVAEKYQIAA